eukprot:5122020-Prymnesium_polylepis.1
MVDWCATARASTRSWMRIVTSLMAPDVAPTAALTTLTVTMSHTLEPSVSPPERSVTGIDSITGCHATSGSATNSLVTPAVSQVGSGVRSSHVVFGAHTEPEMVTSKERCACSAWVGHLTNEALKSARVTPTSCEARIGARQKLV